MRWSTLFRLWIVVAAAAVIGTLGAPSAHAAALRECTTVGTWTFEKPLTATNDAGYVDLRTWTQCVRYTAGGGFTIDEYPSAITLWYSGNCEMVSLVSGATRGVMVREQTIAYAGTNVFSSPGVHVVTEHPTCSGATTLTSFAHWYYIHG